MVAYGQISHLFGPAAANVYIYEFDQFFQKYAKVTLTHHTT